MTTTPEPTRAVENPVTGLGPVTRYLCPLPNCGWTHDTTPTDGPLATERAMRLHVDDHSILEYLRALNAERADRELDRRALAAALGHSKDAAWAALIAQTETVRAAATERADLLTEARDVLEQAGQTGAHGDDWPAIAPAIRALAAERDTAVEGERHVMDQRRQMAEERYAWQERGDRAEKHAKQAEAFRDAVYEALGIEDGQLPDTAISAIRGRAVNIREQAQRAEQAEAAITRVRDAADNLADGTEAGFGAALTIRRALDGEQPTTDEVQHCCVCGSTHVAYHNYANLPFCGPCAGCGCGETPCERTGINDPTVSDEAEPERPCPALNTALPARTTHCDLTAGHEGHHRDSTVPGILRWTDDAPHAAYPAHVALGPEPVSSAEPDDTGLTAAEPELLPILDYAVGQVFALIRRRIAQGRG